MEVKHGNIPNWDNQGLDGLSPLDYQLELPIQGGVNLFRNNIK